METIDEKNYLKKLGAYFFKSILAENNIDVTTRSTMYYLEVISHQINLNNIRDQEGLLLYIEYLIYDNVETVLNLDVSRWVTDALYYNAIYLVDELPFAMNRDPLNLAKIGNARTREINSAIDKMGVTMDSVLSKPHYSKFLEYKNLLDKMSTLSELNTSLQIEKSKKEREISNMVRPESKDIYERYKNVSLSHNFLVQLEPYMDELISQMGLQISEGRKHDYLQSMREKVSDGTIDNIEGAKLYLKTLLQLSPPTVSELGLDTRPRNALYGGGFFLLCDIEEATPEILRKQRGMGEQSYEIIVKKLNERGITISEFGKKLDTPISRINRIVEVDGVQIPNLKVDIYKKTKNNISTLQERLRLIDLEIEDTKTKIDEFKDKVVGKKDPVR